MKNGLFILVLIFTLFSCKPDADGSLQKLQQLNGSWISTQNTVMYFKWKTTYNYVSGFSFSLQNNDTLFFNHYKIYKTDNRLTLHLSPYNNKHVNIIYNLKKSWFGKFHFIANDEIYPYRITLTIVNDTLWQYQQENIRGNKVIAFEMKKIEP